MRRLLDSRSGVLTGLVLIVACFSAVAIFFVSQFEALQTQKSVFQGLKMREGFVALSDLQRVNLIVLEALREGEMKEETARELDAAIDFLFVRNEAFRERLLPDSTSDAVWGALRLMERVVELTDAAKEEGYRDLVGLSGDLITVTDEARRLLFVFLDEKRRQLDILVDDQQRRIARQTVLLLGFFFCLTLAGSAALLLFRRESQMRQNVERAENRAHYLAYYDSLTGLPNRVLFRDRVQQTLSSGRGASMIFADLDNFKEINDTLGHATGDCVLQAVGGHLRTAAESRGGIAARLAGDEFALFLPTSEMEAIQAAGAEVIDACRTPVSGDNGSVSTGLSIGVATAEVFVGEAVTYDGLLRMADFALYAAKTAGRGRIAVFDAELEARFNGRRALMAELPRAIGKGEVSVYLQPKLLIATGEIYGFEALARWPYDDRILTPNDFIELAETSGAIIDLDLYMLVESARLIADWNRQTGTELSVSVNLSAAHFKQRSVVEDIAHALTVSGLRADLLTIEITETVQILNWEQVRGALTQIRRLGCKIAIDDFGSGYSSLAYLRAIQADELKIDRSLVSEIESSEEARFILDSVVDLAHSLRMEVVVEGVESERQLRSLKALGCRRAQGFLIGRPSPASEALAAFGSPSLATGAGGQS